MSTVSAPTSSGNFQSSSDFTDATSSFAGVVSALTSVSAVSTAVASSCEGSEPCFVRMCEDTYSKSSKWLCPLYRILTGLCARSLLARENAKIEITRSSGGSSHRTTPLVLFLSKIMIFLDF